MARNRRTNDIIFEESLFNNLQDYHNFECRLIDQLLGRFDILNCPKEIYLPYVLKRLITRNEVLFFKDEDLNEFIMYDFVTGGAHYDIYMRPTERTVICPNGAQYHLTDKNSVIIKGSNSGTSILPIVQQYARKLYIISRTIDINVHAFRTPTLILCDQDERLSFEQIYKDYEGFAPVIKGSKDMDLSKVQALNLNAPVVFDKLYQLQQNIWNEFLCFCGVSSVNTQKKERLITSEVESALGGNFVERNNFCCAIKRGLDEANEMFGLDMKLLFCGEEFNFEPTNTGDCENKECESEGDYIE